MKTVVVANGDFPTNPKLLDLLKNATTIVACDGAANNLLSVGVDVDFVIGDLDSINPIIEKRFFGKIVHIAEQESNDLTKAIRFCKSRNYDNIVILGATGKRCDHTIANISLLAEYIDIVEDVKIYDDYGIFTAIKQSAKFKSFAGQTVSVFSLTPDTEITYSGLEYPVEAKKFTSWWQGTLNKSLGTEFEIKFDTGKIVVFQGV